MQRDQSAQDVLDGRYPVAATRHPAGDLPGPPGHEIPVPAVLEHGEPGVGTLCV